MLYTHRTDHFVRLAFDLVLLGCSFFIASFFAKVHMGFSASLLGIYSEEWTLLASLLVIWMLSSRFFGIYDEFRIRSFSFVLLALLKMVVTQTLFSIFFLFFAKQMVLSRFFIGINMVLQLVLIGSGKVAVRISRGRQHRLGKKLRFFLVIGTGKPAREFWQTLEKLPHLGYRIIGFLDDREAEDLGALFLGKISRLDEILDRITVDDIIITEPGLVGGQMERILSVRERHPVSLRLIPDFFDTMGTGYRISTFAHFPIVSLRTIPLDELLPRLVKRGFDLLICLLLFALVFSWLWPLIALLIKLSSPGPVFFKQERWGMKNRLIVCYKFRTMAQESRDVDERGRYQQAGKDDPRVTRLGRWLRKTSLDELPQFINVLKGDMSVVGPRPHPTPLNLQSMDRIENYMLRHLIKPGITGWAQINGLRGETREPELMVKRVAYDLWYIENWSFWLDLQILVLTLWQVLRGDPQAY